jgi:hypothetical protein
MKRFCLNSHFEHLFFFIFSQFNFFFFHTGEIEVVYVEHRAFLYTCQIKLTKCTNIVYFGLHDHRQGAHRVLQCCHVRSPIHIYLQ